MSDNSPLTDTRRNVLKKGAATASLLAGGTLAASGSAAASQSQLLTVEGYGEYQIQLYADDIRDPYDQDGITLSVVEYETVYDDINADYLWAIEGEVRGTIDDDGEDWEALDIYGFDELQFGPLNDDVTAELDGYGEL
jgi:hypothetical protein